MIVSGTLHGQSSPEPSPPPAEIVADDKPLEVTSSGLRVPASHKSVAVHLGRPAREGAHRTRFQLVGVDKDWREVSSQMCLMVRFANAAGDQIAQQIFEVTGRSSGWRGSVEMSDFTARRESVRVPEGSAYLTAAISSSGPPTALGIYLVNGLKIHPSNTAEAPLLEVKFQPSDLQAPNAAATTPGEGADAVPQGWRRSGTRPSMAKVLHSAAGDSLCILDDDPTAHAEWNLPRTAAPAVHAGEMLTIEWQEMHDIGMGNRFEINYGTLDAGRYQLLVNELGATGLPLAAERRIDFVVLQSVWRNPWFWTAALTIAGLLLWWACRVIIRARIRHHLARVEQERMVERERLRIARDLHDDLGARLTHISLVSGLAENDPQSAPARESFRRISSMARDLVAALYQTVWSVNPENDDLESLANFVCQLTERLCEAAGIRCRIHSSALPGRRRVTSEVRHNLTLAVKEAVHNAVKHARGTEITVQIEFADPQLIITVADNGQGFDPASIVPGHGLANMRRRTELIGGTLSVESSSGTKIRFSVPIPADAKHRTPPPAQTIQ